MAKVKQRCITMSDEHHTFLKEKGEAVFGTKIGLSKMIALLVEQEMKKFDVEIGDPVEVKATGYFQGDSVFVPEQDI